MEASSRLSIFILLILRPVACLSRNHIYDLSHAYHGDMPVWEDSGEGPPEISLVEQDEGHGLRYVIHFKKKLWETFVHIVFNPTAGVNL